MDAEVDILITGVTGFVGRFVLYKLLTDNTDSTKQRIAVIIRSQGKRTAVQRFQEEIVNTSLFATIPNMLLSQIRVIDAAIENIETTTHQIRSAQTIIHCAANVKHYDPYEALERDNVQNVRRMLRLAETLGCQTLVLLSTCYLHPTTTTTCTTTRPAIRIQPSPARHEFLNDYCYTKWLGEEAVFAAKTTIPNIQIIRLSCVGAPVDPALATHPVPAQAHLGLITFALRGYLQCLAARQTARISVIPVDIAAKAILAAAKASAAAPAAPSAAAPAAPSAAAPAAPSAAAPAAPSAPAPTESDTTIIHTPKIQQICPPPTLTSYHLSIPDVFALIRTYCGAEEFVGLIRTNTTGIHIPLHTRVLRMMTAEGRRSLELHEKIQDFVSTFTDGDIRFESSLAASEFPTFTEKSFAEQTCMYAIRILHDRRLVKGIPVSLSDRFWHRLANREPVQICFTLRAPITQSEWPTIQTRLWNVFASYRKFTTELDLEGNVWKSVKSLQISDYMDKPQEFQTSHTHPSDILQFGLQRPTPAGLWHITPICGGGDQEGITHILIRGDHGLSDGVGALPILQDLQDALKTTTDSQTSPPPASSPTKLRSLPWWLDIWLGIVYVVLLAVTFITNIQTSGNANTNYSHIPTLASHDYSPGAGGPGTYTSRLLWSITQALATHTNKRDFLFAVPANTKAERRNTELPTNSFVPILLPLSANMSESAFHDRCRLLHSKTVRFISWCLQHLLEYTQWDSVRDGIMVHVDAVVSTVPLGPRLPERVAAVHGVTTTPRPVPFSFLALSTGSQTYLTVRSQRADVPAATIMAALAGSKISAMSAMSAM
jgi:nucleoside-diphosphate-sugar epimerase